MHFVGGENFFATPRRGRMRAIYLVIAVLVPLALCGPARAGTYDVYSCRLPDGSPAPANGWAPVVNAPPELGLSVTTENSCASSGGLKASLPSFMPAGVDAGWRFTPPPATTIEGFEIARAISHPTIPGSSVSGYVTSLGNWPPVDLDRDTDERCVSGGPK